MFSPIIENTLRGFSSDSVTDFFIILILVLFFLSLFWLNKDTHHKFVSYTPSLLTSVGILGTFTGIVIGLLDFNPKNIDGSITLLLEGLKVAFISSLVGILTSITFKFISSTNFLSSKSEEEITRDEVGIEDLYSVMKQQNENLLVMHKLLGDSNDSSLVGQVKLFRSDISDHNKIVNTNMADLLNYMKTIKSNSDMQLESFTKFEDKLWIKMQDFADMLSKSATEQVINALKQVISDFNNNLIEQFGDNFKALNASVEKLVTWQDNYKEQLSEMKNQFNSSVNSMADMEKSIESINAHTTAIPNSMNNLEKVMTVNQHQVDELSRHLDTFKDIRDRAVEAVPEIKTQIDTTIKGIQDASEELIDGVTKSTDKMSTALVQNAEDFSENVSSTNAALVQSSDTLTASSSEITEQLNAAILDINKNIRSMVEELVSSSKDINSEFKDTGTTLLTEFKNSNDEIQNNIADLTSELQRSIENLAKEQVRQVQKVFDGLDSTITQSLQKTGESVKDQVDMMDKVAEKEIENVMNAMGTALARISGQFTNDYQQLVKEMKSITNTHR